MELQDLNQKERSVAYFSMEIGVDHRIPTYSGGLGILAGDTVRSFADLKIPAVGVTLLYKKGYFKQHLDENGWQTESPVEWNHEQFLTTFPKKISIFIEGRDVHVQAWLYKSMSPNGFCIPLILLDTDLPENREDDRTLTHYLYGGDERYRLIQEMILGIAGVRMLNELGFHNIQMYHMNEGHAALLTIELLNNLKDEGAVRKKCVFTTHTPVPAGHDQFDYGLVNSVLGEVIPYSDMKRLAGEEKLNMTLLALNLSHYINGVAKQHGKVSNDMFPGYSIDSITNGVNSARWVCPSYARLFDRYLAGWRTDPFSLRGALNIPSEEILHAHYEANKNLIDYINEQTGAGFDYNIFTIGFARRSATYKRADLVFSDIGRLIDISKRIGKMQFIFSGKAHPKDTAGKELIKKIYSVAKQHGAEIKIAYLEDYKIETAKLLVSGVDLWLNTPQKPKEASGTSGMKAAHNGVPSLSVLDGWWIEGCIEGLTGWAIGELYRYYSYEEEASSLYEKLENVILPTFYHHRGKWASIMSHCIAINASFFNTNRMVQQYVLNAYLD